MQVWLVGFSQDSLPLTQRRSIVSWGLVHAASQRASPPVTGGRALEWPFSPISRSSLECAGFSRASGSLGARETSSGPRPSTASVNFYRVPAGLSPVSFSVACFLLKFALSRGYLRGQLSPWGRGSGLLAPVVSDYFLLGSRFRFRSRALSPVISRCTVLLYRLPSQGRAWVGFLLGICH